ncbi:hypothetical protein DEU56DRAFT_983448 [Suillus clintonianus]|uniref:uncharacterized protein n=1 Tax=Suillus clintonianus TaxID=1904413 RepID=UPI001B85BECF|nr:uncharacterized protein DEU56DRAFT_983448 [Suillus clintonianus]KAG2124790.1 hypothetical protein DEU56DRAFT_983448 [Suillus clintonianus]
MSIPLPGTYKIANAHFKTNQLFDLQGGSVKSGAPIVARGNAKFRSGETQMLWTLQVLRNANPGMIVRLINVLAGTFAQPMLGVPSNGGEIVGGNAVAEWLLTPTATLGQYSLQTTDGTFACSLSEGVDFTRVNLQATDLTDDRQAWVFAPASV